jgi:ATP-dependent RNA helicase RhlE
VTQNSFSDLGLAEPILRALHAKKYVTPTPIQAKAIPELLAGKDVLGIAQTGTGKTAAFALPILNKLFRHEPDVRSRGARALILAPTRELAIQIGDEIRAYGKNMHLRHAVIFGGVSQNAQVNTLTRGVDILVATPGRLLDLMNQRHVKLGAIEFFVLDEADRMLDMGFVRDVRKIASAIPKKRQSLLFSATMPADIAKLSGELLNDPVRVEVTPQATPVERIDQQVHHVETNAKIPLLADILSDSSLSRVIVFTRTKHRANKVADQLERRGINADAIHGNKSQGARQRALKRFRDGESRVLVATDIAARGIDVDGVSHVINFELPNIPDSYVHRIGRTARAGASGMAVSFCDSTERPYLRDIERLIGSRLTVIGDEPAYRAPEKASANSGHPNNANGKPGNKPGRKRNRSRNRRGAPGGNPGNNHGGGNQGGNRNGARRRAA